jgi:hypothetical protein
VGKPIEFYSLFISYSTQDQTFAERLHADLQAKHVRCWFAPHDIQGGKKIHEQIDEAIRVHDKLLLILSPASINSEWVKTEIAKARKRELRETRRMLFPVRLVDFETLRNWEAIDDTGKDTAGEIREYFIPDFGQWRRVRVCKRTAGGLGPFDVVAFSKDGVRVTAQEHAHHTATRRHGHWCRRASDDAD